MISKNAVIGFLLFTATLLICVLIIQNSLPSAQAQLRTTTRTNCCYPVASTATGSTELLWIIDSYSNFLVVYGSNRRGQIIPLDRADLYEVFFGPIDSDEIIVPPEQILEKTPQTKPTKGNVTGDNKTRQKRNTRTKKSPGTQ